MEVKSNELYRMKGVLAIKDFPARFVFQVSARRRRRRWRAARSNGAGHVVWALGRMPAPACPHRRARLAWHPLLLCAWRLPFLP